MPLSLAWRLDPIVRLVYRLKGPAHIQTRLNTLSAVVVSPEAGTVEVAGQVVTLAKAPIPAGKGDRVTLALRPEAVRFGREAGREVVLPATIAEVHFLGSVIRLTVDVDGTMVALDTFNRPDQPPPPDKATALPRPGRA